MNPGTRVECVDDSIRPDRIIETVNMYPAWPVKGRQYTVREFCDNDGIVPGIILEELHNPEVFIALLGRKVEPRFSIERFRELQDPELVKEINLENEPINN